MNGYYAIWVQFIEIIQDYIRIRCLGNLQIDGASLHNYRKKKNQKWDEISFTFLQLLRHIFLNKNQISTTYRTGLGMPLVI